MDRRHFLAAATCLTTRLPAFAAPERGTKGTIKIVSSLPRTGAVKDQTDGIVNAIRMAIADSRGEVAGYKIEYEDQDDAGAAAGSWTAEAEAKNAQTAAADPDVMAYIGPYNSGAAKVSMPLLNEAGLVQVSPSTTWPGLTKKVPGDMDGEPGVYRPAKRITFARVCPTDDIQGGLSATFAKDDLKVKAVYVIDDKELYGAGVANDFKKECEVLKIKVLGHTSIDTRQRNYAALMKRIAGLKPDLVYFGGTTQSQGGQIAKDMVAAGLKCPLMVPDGCYELVFITSAGEENLKNCYVTMGGIDASALTGPGAEFVKKYKAKHRREPEAYAVYGYEAANVVLAAIRTAGKNDREAIRKAVLATKNFEGVLGKWSFDADGDTTLRQVTVSKIDNGKFVPIKAITKE